MRFVCRRLLFGSRVSYMDSLGFYALLSCRLFVFPTQATGSTYVFLLCYDRVGYLDTVFTSTFVLFSPLLSLFFFLPVHHFAISFVM